MDTPLLLRFDPIKSRFYDKIFSFYPYRHFLDIFADHPQSVSKFKATCLSVLEDVKKQKKGFSLRSGAKRLPK